MAQTSRLHFTCTGTGPEGEGEFHYDPRIPQSDWDRYWDLVELAAGRPLDAEEARDERDVLRQELERLLGRFPEMFPAYESIANLYSLDDDLEEALAWYRKGVAVAERAMPDGYEGTIHWADTGNRPYLRAQYGVARMLFAMRRYSDAAEEMRWHLRTNPYDAMGVRFELPQVLLHAGHACAEHVRTGNLRARRGDAPSRISVETISSGERTSSGENAPVTSDSEKKANAFFAEALEAFEAELSQEGQVPEPASLYGCAYVLIRLGRYAEAICRLRRAFLENVYVAELVLEREPVVACAFDAGRGGSSSNGLSYAYDYAAQHGDVWEDEPVSGLFMALAMDSDRVKEELRMFFEYKTMLAATPAADPDSNVVTTENVVRRQRILSFMEEVASEIDLTSSREVAESILADLQR